MILFKFNNVKVSSTAMTFQNNNQSARKDNLANSRIPNSYVRNEQKMQNFPFKIFY